MVNWEEVIRSIGLVIVLVVFGRMVDDVRHIRRMAEEMLQHIRQRRVP